MRGRDHFTESLFSMHKLEDYVPADHPLRLIQAMVVSSSSCSPPIAILNRLSACP
jgi:hypothetical protein